MGRAGHGVAIAAVRVAIAMIEFSGQLDEKLYRRVLRLQMGRGGVTFAVLMIVCALCIAFTAHSTARFGAPLFAFLLAAFIFLNPYLIARRGLKTGAMVSAPFHGSADEAHFVLENEYGRSDVPWPKFFRVQTGPDFLMLYISAHQFFILARSYFANDADWESFRKLATSNVPEIKSGSVVKTIGLWFLIIVTVLVIWAFFRR